MMVQSCPWVPLVYRVAWIHCAVIQERLHATRTLIPDILGSRFLGNDGVGSGWVPKSEQSRRRTRLIYPDSNITQVAPAALSEQVRNANL